MKENTRFRKHQFGGEMAQKEMVHKMTKRVIEQRFETQFHSEQIGLGLDAAHTHAYTPDNDTRIHTNWNMTHAHAHALNHDTRAYLAHWNMTRVLHHDTHSSTHAHAHTCTPSASFPFSRDKVVAPTASGGPPSGAAPLDRLVSDPPPPASLTLLLPPLEPASSFEGSLAAAAPSVLDALAVCADDP